MGITQVAAVDDVTSTSQITDLYAKATERRRLATSGSTSALIAYRLTITKLVTEELGSVEAQLIQCREPAKMLSGKLLR